MDIVLITVFIKRRCLNVAFYDGYTHSVKASIIFISDIISACKDIKLVFLSLFGFIGEIKSLCAFISLIETTHEIDLSILHHFIAFVETSFYVRIVPSCILGDLLKIIKIIAAVSSVIIADLTIGKRVEANPDSPSGVGITDIFPLTCSADYRRGKKA